MGDPKAASRNSPVWNDGRVRVSKTPDGKPIVETAGTDALGGARWDRVDRNAFGAADDERLVTTRLAAELIRTKEELVRLELSATGSGVETGKDLARLERVRDLLDPLGSGPIDRDDIRKALAG